MKFMIQYVKVEKKNCKQAETHDTQRDNFGVENSAHPQWLGFFIFKMSVSYLHWKVMTQSKFKWQVILKMLWESLMFFLVKFLLCLTPIPVGLYFITGFTALQYYSYSSNSEYLKQSETVLSS